MRGNASIVAMRLLFPILMIALLAAASVARTADPPPATFRDCADCPEMVTVPAGDFVMGSPKTEAGRFDAEGPQHTVTLRAFALAPYEVTVHEFLAFLEATRYQPLPCDRLLGLTWEVAGRGKAFSPGYAEAPGQPAVCLSWTDAQAYLKWLNRKARGDRYRLPSEAEWEYAARAGTTAARWWGEAIGVGKANCNGCGSQWDNERFAPVGSFGPNPWGLYDMLGNVWQWTDDCWNESYVGAPTDGSAWKDGDCDRRVLRGGSWDNLPVFVRSAARGRAYFDNRDFDYATYAGFRVAKTLP